MQLGCDWFPSPHESAASAVPEFSISGEMDLHHTLPAKGDNLTEQMAFATSAGLLNLAVLFQSDSQLFVVF